MDTGTAILTFLLVVSAFYCEQSPVIDVLSIVEKSNCTSLIPFLSAVMKNILLCARYCGMIPVCVAMDYKKTNHQCRMFHESCPSLVNDTENFHSNISSWPEQIQFPRGHTFLPTQMCVPGPNGEDVCIFRAVRNRAIGKPASQDRTYYSGHAAYGVDGDWNTFAFSGMHWQVDLQEQIIIRSIYLKARSMFVDTNLCVKIDGVECVPCLAFAAGVLTTTILVCNPALTGQIISVEKNKEIGYLHIFELEAFDF